MPPTTPINHYLRSRNQQNRTEVLSYYSMLRSVFKAYACLKHSNFLKIKIVSTAPHTQVQIRSPRKCPGRAKCSPRGRTGRPRQKSNYELFNRNNFNIRYWSWNYRGCWRLTCHLIISQKLHLSNPKSDTLQANRGGGRAHS